GQMPTGVVEDVDEVEQRDIETIQVAHQRQQHGDYPDRYAGQQSDNVAAAVGGWPVEYRAHAGKELQRGYKGNDAQVGQVLLGAKQQIEAITGHDDGEDQTAARPFQPAVDVALGWRLIERQNQMVERHARQCQRAHD